MTYRCEKLPLLSPGAGTELTVLLHRFGDPGARPKAYIQASIHADEIPAMMAAHHLLQRLDEAEKAGLVRGEIVLVPYANPIGLGQWVNERHLGRYEQRGGGNFNRNWMDLEAPTARKVEGRLGSDADANVAVIRDAMLEVLSEQSATRELGSLKLALAKESLTADLVLDLHCDDEALLHLFLLPQHWPDAADLAGELGAEAILLDEDTGGGAFDESNSKVWVGLQRRFPEHPIPAACLATTVELRGKADVCDRLGRQDADAIYRCLVRRGFIAGDVPPPPPPPAEATPLDAAQIVRAPAAGIIAYKVALGDRVTKGQVIAELVDPAAPAGVPRAQMVTATDGLVMQRRLTKLVLADQGIAKIVGKEPLPPETAFILEA